MPGDVAAPSDVRWDKTYEGQAATVREVRHDIQEILGSCPDVVAGDVVLVASELAANAIRHSRSGTDGGTYVVRVAHHLTEKVPYIWIEVEDQGSPSWDGILRPEPTHGLSVVESLSTWMGADDGPEGQRTVYARLEYHSDGTPLYGVMRSPELSADLQGIRDSES
jgi:anti-sigma regulatory factor (Ser/Thr protein kinase)